VWIVSGHDAIAQVANPGNPTQAPSQAAPPPADARHTWEMPPVDVFGKAPLVEEDRIGAYAQPRWTAHRRLSETRVYVRSD
jgi:hypothetical protein